ncbi:transaldolase [Robiginitalea myxolifaciens]|nr:transaldolase [Robiginitalea myxolifaciens]
MRLNYLALGLLSVFWGCKNQTKEATATILAGEIVNPTSDQVVLLKGEIPQDTAYLDAENRFTFRLDNLEDGLYAFNHHPEYQYVFLQQGDSMQVRLNTVAFDESLVFSGQGEQINNYLIDLFLQDEREEEIVRRDFVKLEPIAFGEKLDSIRDLKNRELAELNADGELSPEASEMASSCISYQDFYYREGYPFWHRSVSGDKMLHELPEDFYAYRSAVNYENAKLTYLRPYYDFMKYHIGNIAFMSCQEACKGKPMEVSDQLHFNRHQLQLIDSLVAKGDLRDNLFRTVALNYLLKHDTAENFNVFMDEFHEYSPNNQHLAEIETLHGNIQQLQPGAELPAIALTDHQGETVMLNSLASSSEELIIYFWSGPQLNHLGNINKKIRELKASPAYKKHRFIGICLRTDKTRWEEIMQQYSMNPEDQYWTSDFEAVVQKLLVYHPFKSLFVADGKIVDGFANLSYVGTK